MHSVRFVDSHTAGEPTRVILDAPFDLGPGSLSERREIVARKFDSYRRAFCNEPRRAIPQSERFWSRFPILTVRPANLF